MKALFTLFLVCFASAGQAWAVTGTMIKADALKAGATTASATVGQVGKGATVEVLQRQGGWTQVKHGSATGWVRILSVRLAAGSSASALGGIVQMGSSRADSSRVVAVAGLRGLTEDELRGARFNANELGRLHQFASSRADAEQFARGARLQSARIAYIKRPKAESKSPTNNLFWGDGGL